MNNQWNSYELEYMTAHYSSSTIDQLVLVLDRTPGAIYNQAYKMGLKKAGDFNRESKGSNSRKHIIDTSYFCSIDTFDKAYILGLLWSDGNVYQNSVSFGVKKSDEELTYFIKHKLKTTSPVFYAKKDDYEEMSIIKLNSYRICGDLGSYNLFPNKSYIQAIPSGIADNLKSHFVRGLFDGDGTLNVGKKSRYGIKIVNTHALCRWLLCLTRRELGIGGGVYSINSNTSRWEVGGKDQVKSFASWIYRDAPFFLARKYNKFMGAGLI